MNRTIIALQLGFYGRLIFPIICSEISRFIGFLFMMKFLSKFWTAVSRSMVFFKCEYRNRYNTIGFIAWKYYDLCNKKVPSCSDWVPVKMPPKSPKLYTGFTILYPITPDLNYFFPLMALLCKVSTVQTEDTTSRSPIAKIII